MLSGLGNSPYVDVHICGVGMAKAAAKTAKLLAQKSYRGVINMGIAGGFPGEAQIGSIVVAESIIAPEIGAESPEGFIPVDELGFGSQRMSSVVDSHLLGKLAAKTEVRAGMVLSVLTATGTAETMKRRMTGHGAVAEAMEGFGVASATEEYGVPFTEIRAISNMVGIRDKASWDFPAAFAGLKQVAECLKEVEESEHSLFTMS
ncbi:futalosine hydrolase [Bacillus sp. JCM 19041]|uniref:futalosine hydrolase n=1 Tax=Bacillus sp. JCM 19041 TaxID=1460637 RepID=UPI0006D0660B